MNRLIAALLILGIVVLLGIGAYSWHVSECWAWYDSGYDDAMKDFGIVVENGHIVPSERDWLIFEAGYDFAFEYIDVERPAGSCPHPEI